MLSQTKRLSVYLITMLVFHQVMNADYLYATANWQGAMTVNNQTIWGEEEKRNFFVSVLNLGVEDQLFNKNRLSMNLFLPYREESTGSSSYSPSATASVVGENYSLFTNYGVFTTSDQLLGGRESRREQASLNIFPSKLPAFTFSYNNNEEVKNFSGEKGPSATDWTLSSNYTFKNITLRGGYRGNENRDASENITFKNNAIDWGAATTFQPLPRTSVSASYDFLSSSSENLLTNQISETTGGATSLQLFVYPFEWASISGGYSLSSTEDTLKQSSDESRTDSINESRDVALTITPYYKLSLRTSLGQKSQEQAGDVKTTDTISYGASYNTTIIKNIDASFSLMRAENDDSSTGKITSDTFSLSANLPLHPRAEVKVGAGLGRNDLSESQVQGQALQTYSNSWTLDIVSAPTDNTTLNVNYQTGGSSETFKIFKAVSQSANINLRYIPKQEVSYNLSSVSIFGSGTDQTTLTGSMAYMSYGGSSITVSYSEKFGETRTDSFSGQLFLPLPKGFTMQVNFVVAPLFSGEGGAKSLGMLLTKRL